MDLSINITPGPIHRSIFHRVHEQDLAIECHMRKAPKISYQAPRKQQTVCPPCSQFSSQPPSQLFGNILTEDTTTSAFLNLIHNWWLVINAKERFHPDVIGSALIANDGKIEF